jgi:hypothetical protein
MRRGILTVGKSRRTLLHLLGTGLPILQQAIWATGVFKHRLAAAGQQGHSGNEEPPLATPPSCTVPYLSARRHTILPGLTVFAPKLRTGKGTPLFSGLDFVSVTH